jgi:cytoskeletal protein CcmA (bactofilin family)
MLGRSAASRPKPPTPEAAKPAPPLLAVVGDRARMEGKFDIPDSIQIECEVGGELNVGGQLLIGRRGVVNATVRTVHAVIQGVYRGRMVATGDVEIAATGRVTADIETDALAISKGGFFNGNVVKPSPRAPVHLVEGGGSGAPA